MNNIERTDTRARAEEMRAKFEAGEARFENPMMSRFTTACWMDQATDKEIAEMMIEWPPE